MMTEIAEVDGRTENELARLDPAGMHAAGAHFAEIRVASHLIAVSTMGDAERVRDYVVENTGLRFTGCHPEDDGHVVTFRTGGD